MPKMQRKVSKTAEAIIGKFWKAVLLDGGSVRAMPNYRAAREADVELIKFHLPEMVEQDRERAYRTMAHLQATYGVTNVKATNPGPHPR